MKVILIQPTIIALNVFLTSCLLAAEPPKAVIALAGAYTGSRTNFGINAQGQVIKRAPWTDTMKADRPVREDGRAFVSTVDEMSFEGRPGAPMKVQGREGYRLNSDGTLGEYFIETFGRTYAMLKLAEGVWTYTTAAESQELGQLGFPKGATGRHVVVKVVNQEGGIETHRISRITTVNWRNAEGQDQWLQYLSLQGVHRKAQ